MWQYLVSFAISSACAASAEYCIKHKKRYLFIFFAAMAILATAVLAGARSEKIGSDVLVYGNYVFNSARNLSLGELFVKYILTIEPLYLVLNFLVSRFTNDSHWLYFFVQLIINVFIFAEIVRNMKHAKMWLSYWVFLTLFYGFCLNGMRQAVAMAVMLYGYRFIQERKLRNYIVCVVIAIGFHYVSVMYILLYWLYGFIYGDKKTKLDKKTIATIAILASVFLYESIIRLISNFVPKYIRYLGGTGFDFSLNPFLVRFPFILLTIFAYKRLKKKQEDIDYLLVMLIGDIAYAQLRSISPALYRISLLLGIYKIEAYPLLGNVFNKKSKMIVDIAIAIILGIIWYYQVVIQLNDTIYPYASDVIMWLN